MAVVGVPKEIVKGETRVALVPESVSRLKKLGYEIRVESGAGLLSGYADELYATEGATIVSDAASLYSGTDVLLKVQGPAQHNSGKHELEMMKPGSILICFFLPLNFPELAQKAATHKVNVIAVDQIPRITKAQRMDALSSQTNLAGYKAVLIAANELGKIFPLMMTAAGTISPAKVVILGAGVAGLQAIATAKRLGAVVDVSDIRPEVKEQVQSLGGRYIEPPESEEAQTGQGGYAGEVSQEYLDKQRELLAKHISEANAVITTAQVPGKKAPVLVSEEMVRSMRPGSVIVDMAAEQGGNCALTKAHETIEVNGVKIVGTVNLPALLPMDASQLYSRNLLSLIEYLTKEGQLSLDPEDEIVQGSLVTRDGQVVHERTLKAIGG
ncbi:MAG: Re/Si-specific NAD(P)(+) transhydrogenase subunit alpha [Spirochaetales bacterium]|nr:Re/Si-specific NAD(P)(+) transhydrogenase subunit alpha [Leptospiraceae bacterium]MCP5483127.1 Re/Si-specific NAD(P)(+) transhydrogenase subunit alpha [Spirochaetales bacterium]MCP5484567.1 Re/Si-specific NAD(P)(+) transhydrogenase subunit alpha [Spirochaetales bacterium]